MLESIPPHKTRSWQRLADHYAEIKDVHMRDLFARDPRRFEKFSIGFDDILVDFSKNRITEQTLDLLTGLARETALEDANVQRFIDGKTIKKIIVVKKKLVNIVI